MILCLLSQSAAKLCSAVPLRRLTADLITFNSLLSACGDVRVVHMILAEMRWRRHVVFLRATLVTGELKLHSDIPI